jgi:hypothetical protein
MLTTAKQTTTRLHHFKSGQRIQVSIWLAGDTGRITVTQNDRIVLRETKVTKDTGWSLFGDAVNSYRESGYSHRRTDHSEIEVNI